MPEVMLSAARDKSYVAIAFQDNFNSMGEQNQISYFILSFIKKKYEGKEDLIASVKFS